MLFKYLFIQQIFPKHLGHASAVYQVSAMEQILPRSQEGEKLETRAVAKRVGCSTDEVIPLLEEALMHFLSLIPLDRNY